VTESPKLGGAVEDIGDAVQALGLLVPTKNPQPVAEFIRKQERDQNENEEEEKEEEEMDSLWDQDQREILPSILLVLVYGLFLLIEDLEE